MDSPLFDLNYGLPNVQLKLESPMRIVQNDGDGTRAGADDLLIGVKWRFLNNEQSKFQLGVYPQLLLPTGDRARGLGEGRSAFVFPVVAQKNWEKWTVYGNVGFWWQTASETRNYLLFSGGHDIVGDTKAMAYIGLRSEEHTSELQSPYDLVCRLLLEKKKK